MTRTARFPEQLFETHHRQLHLSSAPGHLIGSSSVPPPIKKRGRSATDGPPRKKGKAKSRQPTAAHQNPPCELGPSPPHFAVQTGECSCPYHLLLALVTCHQSQTLLLCCSKQTDLGTAGGRRLQNIYLSKPITSASSSSSPLMSICPAESPIAPYMSSLAVWS
jgi:hypothetical protein